MKPENIEVFYFGTPKEGFQTYPHTQAYSEFYNNISQGRYLDVYAFNQRITYTYVRYSGVLTEENMGRKGGCWGVSVVLHHYLFNELGELWDFFEAIESKMLTEEQLVKRTTNKAGSMAFISQNFLKVSAYLDAWTKKIKRELLSEKNSARLGLIPWNTKIANAAKQVVHLHPKSKVQVMQEYLVDTGHLSLSEQHEAVQLLLSEQKEKAKTEAERKKHTQAKTVNDRLVLLEKRCDSLENQNKELRQKILIIEQKSEMPLQVMVKEENELPAKKEVEKSKKKWYNKIFKKLKLKHIIGGGAGLLVCVIIYASIALLLPAEPLPNMPSGVNRNSTSPILHSSNPSVEHPSCDCIVANMLNGRNVYRLNVANFLKYVQEVRGSLFKNKKEFKADLKGATEKGFDRKKVNIDETIKKNDKSIAAIEKLIEGKIPYSKSQKWKKAINGGSYFVIILR